MVRKVKANVTNIIPWLGNISAVIMITHFTMHDIFEVPVSVPSNVYQGAHETEHSDHRLKGLQDSDNQWSHHWHHSEFKHYPKAPAQVISKH